MTPSSVQNGTTAEAFVTSRSLDFRNVKSQERSSQRDARDMKERLRRENSQKTSLKDAVFVAIPLAIPKVSGHGRYTDIQARNLYYVVRDLIQGQTDKTLTQKRFDAILKEYERKNGIIEALYREARGFLAA